MTKQVKGHITYYNVDRGFGFIEPDSALPGELGESVWFHFTRLKEEKDSPIFELLHDTRHAGLKVLFVLRTDQMGRPQAYDIEMFDDRAALREILRSHERDASITPGIITRLSKFTGPQYEELVQELTKRQSIDTSRLKHFEMFCAAWESLRTNAFSSKEDAETIAFSLGNALLLEQNGNFEFTYKSHAILVASTKRSALRCFRDSRDVHIVVHPSGDSKNAQAPTTNTRSGPSLTIYLPIGLGNEPFIQSTTRPKSLILVFSEIMSLLMAHGAEAKARLQRGQILRDHVAYNLLRPYDVGVEYNERTFRGRTEERGVILDSGTENAAILGGRKFGKTWLAKHIEYLCETVPEYKAQFLPAYYSIQSAISAEDAARGLLDFFNMRGWVMGTPVDPLSSLKKSLLKIQSTSDKIFFLMLDEVDHLLHAGDLRLFELFRELQANYPGKFKFCLIGFKELFAAFFEESTNNPIANWISPDNRIQLSFLRLPDIAELIGNPSMEMGFSLDPSLPSKSIELITGGHPYYVQDLCSRIHQVAFDGKRKVIDVELIKSCASESFLAEMYDIYNSNLSYQQLIVGALFHNKGPFTLSECVKGFENLGLPSDSKNLSRELMLLLGFSIVSSRDGKFSFNRSEVSTRFFQNQDPMELALELVSKESGNK